MRSHYDHYPLRAVDSIGDSSTASSATHALSSASLQPQEEDWITRKKVETVTRKNLERHLQRQVVLDDGRVIEEDEPHVTHDLIEDSQAHEDSGTEEMGTWNGGRQVTSKGDTVLGERFQRSVNTNDVRTSKTSTAAAVNLGELTRQDVDDVLERGERGIAGDLKSFIAKRNPGFNDSRRNDLVIPARVVHSDRSHARKVDREDVHEVNRAHKGRVVTDRIVSRETVEDDNVETPDYSSSSSTVESSRDGGAHGYTDRKEEKFVDYYRVAPGKPTTSGQHIRRGVHMSSRDRESFEKPRTMNSFAAGPALTFEGKPPRPERQYRRHSRDQRSRDRMPSSERSLPTKGYRDRRSPSAGRRVEEDTGRRFHTIERSEKVGRSTTSTSKYQQQHQQQQRSSRSSSRPLVSKPPRSSMSRSVSRSSELDHRKGSNNEFSTVRKDLDPERESRLRRTLSFNSNKENSKDGGMKSDSSNKSFLGSVKSLYATISKNAKKMTHHPDYYSKQQEENWRPMRPPRKHHRSSSHLAGSGTDNVDSSLYSDNVTGRSWSAFSTENNGSKGKGWRTYSSGDGHASSRAVATTATHAKGATGHSWSPYKMAAAVKDVSRGRQGGGKKLERRQTIGAGDNRDPPKFEDPRRMQRRPRDRSYFGEDDDDSSGGGGGGGGGGGWRERPGAGYEEAAAKQRQPVEE